MECQNFWEKIREIRKNSKYVSRLTAVRQTITEGNRARTRRRRTVICFSKFAGQFFSVTTCTGWAKEWFLGCVNSCHPDRGSQEAGNFEFTQPTLLNSPVHDQLLTLSTTDSVQKRSEMSSVMKCTASRPHVILNAQMTQGKPVPQIQYAQNRSVEKFSFNFSFNKDFMEASQHWPSK